MNFRRGVRRDEPEINFVPLIDVLLVVLIFLMITTTYSRFTELQVELPSASGEAATERPAEIDIGISADGRFRLLGESGAQQIPRERLPAELGRIAAGRTDPVLVVHADAAARHQDVIAVLSAAREAGLAKVTFAAQTDAGPASSGR